MAMLASKPSFPTAMGGATYQNTSSAYRNNNNNNGVYGSPTESEFSDSSRMSDTVKNWDEQRVAEWLISINCGQYVDIFKNNNITGENLMDMDPATLKEMGVNKIGDRVRIGSQAKLFRTT
ncbi:hypothetical protein KCU77_g21982, partial [Aureobasidium melanogenum]